MVRVTTRARETDELSVLRVPGTIADLLQAIGSAAGDHVVVGEFRNSVSFAVSEVVGLETETPSAPAIPTRRAILDEDRRRRWADLARERETQQRRDACRGGAEIVIATPDGEMSQLVARPIRDVIWEIVSAPSDAIQLNDGLGGAVTIRCPLVTDVRALS